MYFLVDEEKQVIFGWSPKCGCSHIKKLFWFLKLNDLNHVIHTSREMKRLPKNVQNYTIIMIVRNPYKRLVSGFLDKYRQGGEYRYKWKESTITFSAFVEELIRGSWRVVDSHHFKPQTDEYYDEKVFDAKVLKCFDLENIDYKYIESLYDVKIPKDFLAIKHGHERSKSGTMLSIPVYDLDMSEYYTSNVNYSYFFNEELREKVNRFFQKDFELFEKFGFKYTI